MKNVGKVDAKIRTVIAIVMIIVAFVIGLDHSLGYPLLIFGAVLALTARLGFCGLYKILGINTCPIDQR